MTDKLIEELLARLLAYQTWKARERESCAYGDLSEYVRANLEDATKSFAKALDAYIDRRIDPEQRKDETP